MTVAPFLLSHPPNYRGRSVSLSFLNYKMSQLLALFFQRLLKGQNSTTKVPGLGNVEMTLRLGCGWMWSLHFHGCRVWTEPLTKLHSVTPRKGKVEEEVQRGTKCTGRALPGLPTPWAGWDTSLNCPQPEGLPCTPAAPRPVLGTAATGLSKLHAILYLWQCLLQVLWASLPAHILPHL